MREEVVEKLKEVLENKIEEMKKLDSKTLTEEQKKNLADLEKDKAELDQLLEERKKYKDQIEYNKKNKISPSQKNNPSYKLQPINKKLEEMIEKYDIENLKAKEQPEQGEAGKKSETKPEQQPQKPQASKAQQLANLEKQLKETAERMKAYRDGGFYAQEAGEHSAYNEILRKINELKAKMQPEQGEAGKKSETKPEQQPQKPQSSMAQQLANLEKQLRESAERMKAYKDGGFYAQEASEHSTYNEILRKISELKAKMQPEQGEKGQKAEQQPQKAQPSIEQQIADLEKQLRESAKRMKEYKDGGFYAQEASEHSTYNEILRKISELKTKMQPEQGEAGKKSEQTSKKEPTKQQPTKQQPSKWHPDLTQDQIDELVAEGLEPGDQEYDQYLRQHGIDPNKYKDRDRDPKGKEPIKWHPDLTQDQIDELMAEGLEPGDQEYDQYLRQHGIDPNKYKDKNPKGKEGTGKTNNPTPPGPTGKEGEGKGGTIPTPPGPTGKEGEGKGGTNPTPPGPGEKPIEEPKNLPVRSFWEIYNDTCTEHVGSIAHTINKLAHMKILPAKQEDTVHKVLSGILVPLKFVAKPLAKIPNAIMGTDKKIKEMQENIDGLKLAEFQVLVQSPEKVNEMFNAHVKDTFDRDYLDPQFMKQYKVNGAYLDTVRARLGRERGTAISYYTQQAQDAHTRMQELEEVGKDNWTPEQTNEYNQMVEIYQQSVDEGKKFQGELDTFDEGAKKKSSSYRNISGWFLAKFNPDNREENAQMAGLSKARREMARQGNRTEVNAITGQMQQLARDNTDLKGGQKNYIDRGQYSIESPVEALDRGPQTKGRLLLTNIAVLSSAAGLFKQMSDNRINREAVEAHNQHLQGVNQQNQNFQVSGQAKVSDSPTAPQAEEAITRQTVEAGWNRAERGDLDATNWDMGSAYHTRDAQSHADGAQAAATADSYLQQGNNLDALKTATDYYTKVQNANRSDIANYMSTHSQHDYAAFSFGDSADMAKVYDFFANGVVPYDTTVNGVMAEMMPSLRDGLDLNGVIFAGANALYQAQREGIKDLRKQVRVTPTRQEEEPEQEEPEQEQPQNEQNNNEHENDEGR